MSGMQVGWLAGSLIGSAFAPGQKTQGPRLGDLSVATSSYGTPIPYTQGNPRLAGQIVWASAKREIATTTSQGKGGGSKSTTYSYEVDLLYLLTDNLIEGVSRVWSNGKLVWNKSATADSTTIANSDTTSAWTRITAYTGGPAQLPDPTYEAAVGSANAPAYRGRGSVFIQGLQLGNSGQIPNITFELSGIRSGDHTPGDGLTIFQTSFASAVSNDVSVSNLGAGVELGAGTKVNGYYTADFDAVTTTLRGIIWYADTDLSLGAGEPLTCEVFFTCIELEPDVASSGKIFQLKFGNATLDVYMRPFSGGINPIQLCFSGTCVTTTTDVYSTGITPGFHHLATVYRSTNLVDAYLDGVRVIEGFSFAGDSTGQIQMGGEGVSYANRWRMRYNGGRVRRAAVYTGASFTPPTGPAAWGSP